MLLRRVLTKAPVRVFSADKVLRRVLRRERFIKGRNTSFRRVPPGTKPIHAGKNSWGINFSANTCGACIRTRANTGKYFRGVIFCILAKILREIISGRIHVAPVFAPARIQENIPGELFMYWFCARGYDPLRVHPTYAGNYLLYWNYSGDSSYIFRGLRINLHCSCSFPVLLSRIQLQKITPCRDCQQYLGSYGYRISLGDTQKGITKGGIA